MLSICCLAGGPPGRLGELLEVLRPVAGEIVVAVDDRADRARLERVAQLADVLVAYPFADPIERSLQWLHSLCHGDWIFRIDDDEVPSRALLDALGNPDERLTHVWFPRRWLWDNGWLSTDPWTPDWQLRLVRPGSARFPGRTHIPVEADGSHAYVDAPLYHLDLVVNDSARRDAKARHYEQARPGLRLGGLPLNAAYYLPEVRNSLDVAPVPPEDMRLVRQIGKAPPARIGSQVELPLATREEIDAHWAEAALAEEDYRARIELARPPSPVAGEAREIDVIVTNLGGSVWPGGCGLPEIRLSYRWRGVEHLDEQLRTPLPHDVRPGESARVPVAFRAPQEPGVYELVVDLVHERHRWFGAEASVEVAVGPRRQAVVLVGQPPGDEAFDHRVEKVLARIDSSHVPILVGPKEDWLRDRFGTEARAEPPEHADGIFLVPAGQRRERLKLRQTAVKLQLASQRHQAQTCPGSLLGRAAILVRATMFLLLGLGVRIDQLG